MLNKRKVFEDPEFIITELALTNVITTSSELDEEDWGLGEF